MKANVYFTKDISPEGLIKIYEALGVELKGRVGVKISTGERGGNYYLQPDLIGPLVKKLNGTIVECNTAYDGARNTTEEHLKVAHEHGFTGISNVDIMDSEAEMILPVNCDGHLQNKNYVGSHIQNYDSYLILSHGKGHIAAGMGMSLKNIAIGMASREGKVWIHSAGRTKEVPEMFNYMDDQDGFLESMAEACKSVIDYVKPENMAYITVLNNLSIDCDCSFNPAPPEMADIGIIASLDPVACDKAGVDMLLNSQDPGKASMIERIEDKHGVHVIDAAERLGLGTKEYNLIEI